MSTWTPISETELWDMINASWKRMSLPQRRLWEVIRIDPVKWQQEPYGTEGGGFWVIGIHGQTAIWFNDIEGGFNRSPWSTFGRLDEYWCNQDQLEWTVQNVLNEITTGYPSGGFSGPPESVQ
ncbi:MAG: hypothetical protein LBV12_05810 [Puniceicoccales bacterium]|jgi:hypothetical protein|nr:hypothetical protein [Puniceicoccales bacterium]